VAQGKLVENKFLESPMQAAKPGDVAPMQELKLLLVENGVYDQPGCQTLFTKFGGQEFCLMRFLRARNLNVAQYSATGLTWKAVVWRRIYGTDVAGRSR
jgi:hypothetical protein